MIGVLKSRGHQDTESKEDIRHVLTGTAMGGPSKKVAIYNARSEISQKKLTYQHLDLGL